MASFNVLLVDLFVILSISLLVILITIPPSSQNPKFESFSFIQIEIEREQLNAVIATSSINLQKVLQIGGTIHFNSTEYDLSTRNDAFLVVNTFDGMDIYIFKPITEELTLNLFAKRIILYDALGKEMRMHVHLFNHERDMSHDKGFTVGSWISTTFTF